MAGRGDQATGATNAELTALNSQLQKTLDQQRTKSSGLQNILDSTDVATLFLDTELNLRFFTPAIKSLFAFQTDDFGTPLAELALLIPDIQLLGDARAVMNGQDPVEREIAMSQRVWRRQVFPCRTNANQVEGAVITFIDVTDRKHVDEALLVAKREAELATIAKSRFLAVASHDLRQPLQSLALLHGLLAKVVEGDAAQRLVARMEVTLGAMSGMLNTLLDINQIEAGTVQARFETFPIDGLLGRLLDEFAYHTQAKRLTLRVVRCGLFVKSDPHLLEQMIRNLLSNALKYTSRGKVLLGCRRRGAILSIEIWDTGIGIAEDQLDVIFEEYHQIDNAARERARGLGLGLTIVGSLGKMLDHDVRVRSIPGKGSVFAVEVTIAPCVVSRNLDRRQTRIKDKAVVAAASILFVEDDLDIRELVAMFLQAEGYRVATAADDSAALAIIERGSVFPDLLLADFNLTGSMNGVQLAAKARETLDRQLPVIILTGDISTTTLRTIALENCVYLHKPVMLPGLARRIEALLLAAETAPTPPANSKADISIDPDAPIVFIVDDDRNVREAICSVLEAEGMMVEAFADSEAFFDAYSPRPNACLLVDAYLPGVDGFELLMRLCDTGDRMPAIMITGASDVPMAVRAMKAGASDFIEKPVGREDLLSSISRAFDQVRDTNKVAAWHEAAALHMEGLTHRQRQVMDMVLAGTPSKNIAADLGISQRTVENHRASIMKKTGCRSVPALARLALAAAWDGAGMPD